MIIRLLTRLVPASLDFDPRPVDREIKDGDRLELLSGATVIYTQGHTPGSICLHFPAESLLISGDAIRLRGNRLGMPFNPVTVDMEQAAVSTRRLAEIDFEVLCPGHGHPLIGGAAAQVRAWLHEGS